MTEAWVKFLARVNDKTLNHYINSWERALTRWLPGSYSYESIARALAGAYELQAKRNADG